MTHISLVQETYQWFRHVIDEIEAAAIASKRWVSMLELFFEHYE